MVEELEDWLSRGTVAGFPYEAVQEQYRRVGKHFVAKELLALLDQARAELAGLTGLAEEARTLRSFLQVALDKWDGSYDYRSYLALDLLPVLSPGDHVRTAEAATRQRDVLVVHLLADTLRFEVAALDGSAAYLPEQRPERSVAVKRCRLALRSAQPALRRLGLGQAVSAENPVQAARRLWSVVEAGLSADERRVLRLSMQPVYVIHDEYLFLRVLQAFEATFALLAVHVNAAVHALEAGDVTAVVQRLEAGEAVFRESTTLFSLMATVQVESFRTFRDFTEGASAIQSRSYKTLESLCRTPEPARLDSPAFRSVPEVRERVLAGQANLDDLYRAVVAEGRLSAADAEVIAARMRQFAEPILQWRHTHYRIGVRMLGESPGTGYTEGTPYLREVQDIPVFTHVR